MVSGLTAVVIVHSTIGTGELCKNFDEEIKTCILERTPLAMHEGGLPGKRYEKEAIQGGGDGGHEQTQSIWKTQFVGPVGRSSC